MTKEEFVKEYKSIVERALYFSNKGRREGLFVLDNEVIEEKYLQRDIFEFGMRLVIDGTDGASIDKILSNIINIETDNDKKLLKTIQKEAVLGIQRGDNSRILLMTLNSYVDVEVESTMRYFNTLH